MIIIDLLPFSLSNVNTIVLTVLNELTPPHLSIFMNIRGPMEEPPNL